jgi:hypothetical protein
LCHPRTKKRHWAALTAEQAAAALDALRCIDAGVSPIAPDELSSPTIQHSSSPQSMGMQDYVGMDMEFDMTYDGEQHDEQMDVSCLKLAVRSCTEFLVDSERSSRR